MTELELEAMIQRAAEAGAKRALRDVGLQDDDADHDMRDIPQQEGLPATAVWPTQP